MDSPDVSGAQEALRKREGPKAKLSHIGVWTVGQASPSMILDLPQWATARGLDGVVWTDLPPKFDGLEQTPSEDQVVAYLRGLRGTTRDAAELYVRRAPRQIDTNYRRRLEADFNWTPIP